MAKLYTVKASALNIRSSVTISPGNIVGQYKKGAEVYVYEEKMGERNITWGKVSETESRWVDTEYLKAASSSNKTNKDTTKASASKTSTNTGTSKENADKVEDDSIYGNKDSSYDKLFNRYLKAFGCPPRFTDEVDPRYSYTTTTKIGRATAKTWFANPSILSICPGTVDYLPGFSLSKNKKNKFFNKIKDYMSGQVYDDAKADSKADLNGQLYAFRSAYTDYMNVVNLLARTTANLMGIGDVDDIIAGEKMALKNYDYGYYTSLENSQKATSIFEETKNALNSAVSDSSYIHFFVNYSTGVVGSESFRTEDEESWLEQKLGGDNDLSSAARNMQFLFGTTLSAQAESDITRVINEATDNKEFLGGLTTIAKNYLKGGQLVFPRMIKGMSYDKSISCELTFSSLYGDKRSIFKYVTLPALHLMAMAIPKQISANMYTYPFLVRAYQRGNINTDLAYISNLELTRGGGDNTSWTVDGLATEIVAKFTITPLYANMMVTSSRNPFLYMQNSALLEYLGTMCGLDLKQNNLDVKVKLAKSILANEVHDIPTIMARRIGDSKAVNTFSNITQFKN